MPRILPSTIAAKFKSRVQAPAEGSSPRIDLWLGRPVTPMVTDDFFERQTILQNSTLTKSDIAVRHAVKGIQSDRIFVAYITGGKARVVSAEWKVQMETHVWEEEAFSETAEDVAIAFDADIERLYSGNEEFITETDPWLFWCSGGVLYGRKMSDTGDPVRLANANVTAVSAVRASWSNMIAFDFGLMVFFVIAGSIYYRQYIDGVWYDAVQIPNEMLSHSLTFTDVSVTRTWDYRIVVQALCTDGELYEIYTQYGGLGTRNQDHIEIRKFAGSASNVQIVYRNAKGNDNKDCVELSYIEGEAWLHSTLVPKIIAAYNLPDVEGDWGKIAVFKFDVTMYPERVAASRSAFRIVDENGMIIVASSAVLASDRKTVTLTFGNFNAARGVCRAIFIPNGMKTCAETTMEYTEFSFTPENLVPPLVDPPVPVSVKNITADGSVLQVDFDLPVLSFLSDAPAAFTVDLKEFEYIPEGRLLDATRPVEGVEYLTGVSQDVNLDVGTYNGTDFRYGRLMLAGQEEDNG